MNNFYHPLNIEILGFRFLDNKGIGILDRRLLQYKIKDLPLYDVEERLSKYVSVLREELRSRGIPFRFHVWVSDEWFCPDGVPGFAVPFYIFNPNLFDLQKEEMGFAEGRDETHILKLMRHELGHAIDNAYRLRKNSQRQKVFGPSEKEYPAHYSPKPYSKNYIHYLGDHYAQSHPDEDFAETFAFWLDPSCSNRKKTLSSVVLKKLECMQNLMGEVRHRRFPELTNEFRVDPYEKNNKTLKSHFNELKKERRSTIIRRVDHDLKSSFLQNEWNSNCQSLAHFLRKKRSEHRLLLSRSEGVYQYEADWGIDKIIERAERLGIKAPSSELESKSSTLLQRNFRYLKQKDQLKYYL